ncbi:hypothetical protein FB451DRAFT_1042267, partial [Mycena latifolia]
YWSFDPSGVERLSAVEATNLGLPSIELTTKITGFSGDTTLYTGLRKFHQAKGFDPDSQHLAQHLGQPLYQLTTGLEIPFAHGEPNIR